jgi:hypothetical protein
MTLKAQRCVTVSSSWVSKLILTCDDGTGQHLAIQFKHDLGHHHRRGLAVPGVTCLYPGTNAAWFNAALVFPGPGHFVHHFLYKKMPYRLIPDPCPAQPCDTVTVGCCPDPLLAVLHATFTGGTGTCACLTDVTVPLAWSAVFSRWQFDGSLCAVAGCTCFVACGAGNVWQFGGLNNSPFALTAASGPSCSPLSLPFNSLTIPPAIGNCCTGSVNVVVTV